MLERQVVIPASPDQLWDALTDSESVSSWFGAQVYWDVRPGGQARFVDDDGTLRRGVIDAVLPGRHLSFRWWRDDDTDNDNGASQVTYQLDPAADGTRLTVTEEPVPDARASASAPVAWTPGAAVAHGCARATGTTRDPGAARTTGTADDVGVWTTWDSRLFGCWACAAGPVTATASIG